MQNDARGQLKAHLSPAFAKGNAPERAIIVTRPERAARHLAARLRERVPPRIDIVISPLLEIVPTGILLDPNRHAGIVLTSEHGLLALAEPMRGRVVRAWCVGARTAAAARAAGLDAVDAGGNAQALARRIAEAGSPGRLAYARGRHAQADLPRILAERGIEIEEFVAYEQKPLGLSKAARGALSRSACVLPLFSARTASIFSKEAAEYAVPAHRTVCMSDQIADALAPVWTRIVAPEPTAEAVIEATCRAIS